MGDGEPLDVDWIELARRDALIGRKVVVFKSTGSTNDIAWAYAGNAAHHGLCVLAEEQRCGRGRRGRSWTSGPGESILCSILLIDTAIEAELLTLTAAVATAEAIQNFCGLQAGIKWPNDVLVNGKKLAGILVEKRSVGGRMCFVVGVGINCNQEAGAFEGCELRTPATSVRIETGGRVDRTGLACAAMGAFEEWLRKATGPAGAEAVLVRWAQLGTLLGRHVTVECDNRIYRGYCRGIDPAEGLVVQLESGAVRAFAAGHTSIVCGE